MFASNSEAVGVEGGAKRERSSEVDRQGSNSISGPVLSVTDDMIVVQKGTDKWEIARDASTKVTGDLKVGAKVTIEYRMTATSVDVKPAAEKAAKPATKKK
jgi:hypothetical protein